MAGPKGQGVLFGADRADDGVTFINDRCALRRQDGHGVVVFAGMVLSQFALGDRMAEAHAMVSLVDQGWADQNDVARAFGTSPRTVRRHQRRFETGGLVALGRDGGYPKGRPRLRTTRTRLVSRLKAEGQSNRAIAEHIGVTEKAVRKLLRRLGWQEHEPEQPSLPLAAGCADPKLSASAPSTVLPAVTTTVPAPRSHACPPAPTARAPRPDADPNLSAFSSPSADDEPLPGSWDTDPANRRVDRLFAYLGLLDDAAPLFRSGERVPRAGVLLAVPALVGSGVLSCARDIYGSIGPAFYGLRTTLVALLLLALLRIKRPEGLKEHPPEDLGRLLGLDRAPEVKTLRRKLARLASFGRASQLGRALAERRVATHGAAMGFLYVDGHVRVYHGKRVLPKAHVARMRLSLPATTDYWVNDATGEPLFVVTAEANAGLVKMLPAVLAQVRSLVGERRTTIIFDRGGWSPKLFATLIADGFDILTYRKGRFRRVPSRCFRPHSAVIDGQEVAYTLADQGVLLLGRRLRLRQVTRLSADGHQTPIITSRRDLRAVEVAYRMFERWRQENFFKYLREEYALDVLVDYAVEPDDPDRSVPNPAWHAIDAKLREASAALLPYASQLGLEAITNPEGRRRTMRGFKIANAGLSRKVREVLKRFVALEARRARIPHRVPVQSIVQGEVVKLAAARKHLTDLLKMVAYQAEGDLVRFIAPHYRRVQAEGRTLIQAARAAPADLEVTDTELRVRIAPLSSAHRTRAVTALCDELNRTRTQFPGSRLILHYEIAARP